MQNNFGFVRPEIHEDNHVLGASGVPLPVIQPNGDWTTYLPAFESQFQNNYDSDGCTVYGTLNAIETLEKFLYTGEFNHSDRFTYNTVGITPPGSDPHTVATIIRGSGLIDEIDLPDNVPTLAEFMTPRPLPIDLRVKGQKWLNQHMLGHKWLWDSQPDASTCVALIKDALTKGTVAVSVDAWWQNAQGEYFSPQGVQNGHWVEVYKVDDTGIYAFDSYEGNNGGAPQSYLKKLTLDHNIEFAKVYFFTQPTQEQSGIMSVIRALLEFIGLLQKKPEVAIQPPVTSAQKSPTLNDFCNAIKNYEGLPLNPKTGQPDRNYRNNNPGNCKFYAGGYRLIYGHVTKDEDGFAIFPTYDLGFLYLENLVKSKIVSNHNWTILDYFAKFHAPKSDGNNPMLYASFVASQCKVGIDFKISDLLS